MKSYPHLLLLLFAMLAVHMLPAQELMQFYGSGSEVGTDNVTVLTNSIPDLTFYYLNQQGMLSQTVATPYLGLPNWKEGLLQNPGHSYAGARQTGADTLVLPIFFPDAQGTADQNDFIPLETDPQNDHQFNLNNLDILYTKIAFSETKLFYSLKCNTMSYPVSSGLTFYSYMGILTQPGVDPGSNPTVYGLMNTVSAPGIISPGLYKITGTGMDDMTLIGEIEVMLDSTEGILTLACDLADLINDPDFSSWFNMAYPLVATQAMTSRITLSSGNLVADTTSGARVLLEPWEINFGNNHPPQLQNPLFSWEGGLLDVQINYSDTDHNHAQNLQLSIDGSTDHPLYPVNLDGFDAEVLFAASNIPCLQNWLNASFTVINGGVTTTISFPNPDVHQIDDLSSVPILQVSPNPGRDIVQIKSPTHRLAQLYNMRGQLVMEAVADTDETSINISNLPKGIYILKQGKSTQKIVKL